MQQNTQQWHEFREMKIGASDAASIMGVGFHTPFKLWQIKMGFDEVVENFAMRRGKELEPVARAAFIKESGIEVFPEVVQHPEFEWMMASLDGISFDRKTIIEIKCVGRKNNDLAKMGKVPEKYFPQLQHQMAVTGANSVIYFSFYEGVGTSIKVDRDDEYIEKLIEAEKEFFKCMVDFSPPEKIEADKNKEIDYREDAEWIDLSLYYKECLERKNSVIKEEAYLKGLLIESANGKNCSGEFLKIEKIKRKGTIAYNKIPELQGKDLEMYRSEPTEYWKISIV